MSIIRYLLSVHLRSSGVEGWSAGWADRTMHSVFPKVYLDLGKLRKARTCRSSCSAVWAEGCNFDIDLSSFWV